MSTICNISFGLILSCSVTAGRLFAEVGNAIELACVAGRIIALHRQRKATAYRPRGRRRCWCLSACLHQNIEQPRLKASSKLPMKLKLLPALLAVAVFTQPDLFAEQGDDNPTGVAGIYNGQIQTAG